MLVKKRLETNPAWQMSAVNKHGVTGFQRTVVCSVFDETNRNELKCQDNLYYKRGKITLSCGFFVRSGISYVWYNGRICTELQEGRLETHSVFQGW